MQTSQEQMSVAQPRIERDSFFGIGDGLPAELERAALGLDIGAGGTQRRLGDGGGSLQERGREKSLREFIVGRLATALGQGTPAELNDLAQFGQIARGQFQFDGLGKLGLATIGQAVLAICARPGKPGNKHNHGPHQAASRSEGVHVAARERVEGDRHRARCEPLWPDLREIARQGAMRGRATGMAVRAGCPWSALAPDFAFVRTWGFCMIRPPRTDERERGPVAQGENHGFSPCLAPVRRSTRKRFANICE